MKPNHLEHIEVGKGGSLHLWIHAYNIWPGGAKQNAPAVSSESICLDVSDIGNIKLAKILFIVSRSPHHTPAQSSSS